MRRLLISFLLLTSCYLKQYPVTPAVVEESTYLICSKASCGTAWVVADHYVVSAGHLCDGSTGPFTLTTEHGRNMLATPVAWDISDLPGKDACVLHTDGPTGRPLVLAKEPPHVGAKDGYIGYPRLVFGYHEGVYMSDGGSSAFCDHGASGSAAFTPRGVYGVVVDLRPDLVNPGNWLKTCVSTPIKDVKELLNSVGVGYTGAPDELPNPDEVFPHPGLG